MNNDKEKLQNLRHTAAHLLTAAVIDLWPRSLQTIGPAIENGFYEDLDMGDVKISEADLPKIEQKMHELVKSWKKFERIEMSEKEAREFYKNNPYKLELIDEIVGRGEQITLYKAGNYPDLCRGGHEMDPSVELKHFKLMKLAGAYWRGSEKNKMLTRIYGTAFFSKEELDNYLQMLEEAEKRDHKKLGQELELFIFTETAPGMPYFLPKGLIVFNELLNFSRKVHKDFGYTEVMTPVMSKKELYETSGHWFHYRDDMFISPMSFLREDSKDPYEGTEVFGIKPMNCPNAMTIFNAKTRSYRDLPMRLSETTVLHRFELSGTLNGLFRAREFHQDDSHTFVTVSQIGEEFGKIMDMIKICFGVFNLSYKLRFGTRPENFMGEGKDWDVAEAGLKKVLDESGQEYFEAAGEGAFYGPKVDILMKDSLGREWQTGTIQLDFQQPKNFKVKYIENDGKEVQPAVFHKAIYGSFERFLAILLENFEGKLPTWLSPVQVALLPISDRHAEYAGKVAKQLEEAGFRVEVDNTPERLQAKIRTHTLQRVPFMGIIGDKEIESNALSVRKRSGEDMGSVSLDQFEAQLKGEVDNKIV
ncbi:MAG TPA: threonine--tRNA ligase [Candidatus Eisenbacteria bacterium]|nr:threonine--tRNA ligase [Candidatus Eisenbacteria bacterium]